MPSQPHRVNHRQKDQKTPFIFIETRFHLSLEYESMIRATVNSMVCPFSTPTIGLIVGEFTFESVEEAMNIPLNIEGLIVAGTKYVGWKVKVEDDYENTGGFLILVWNEEKGFDDWVEQPKGVVELFKTRQWQVRWPENLGAGHSALNDLRQK